MDRQDQNAGLLDQLGNFIARKGRRVWPLTVTGKVQIAPHMTRVTFTGPDLDELKWTRGQDVVLEIPTANGISRRHYTIRSHDAAAKTLAIDFVLHGDGPATSWAVQARPGHFLGVGGPRGSFVIPDGFDWHLLIGDETALPSISRRIEELPAGTRVAAVLEARDPSARIEFDTQADLYAVWCYRNEEADGEIPGTALLNAVRETFLPDGEGYVWAAGEAASIRAVRQHLTTERGIDKSRIRASSYWKRGAAAVHEALDD